MGSKVSFKDIERNIRKYISQAKISRVGIAFSGGADSICLLHLLSKIHELQIYALHCNFHLRGEESNRDEMHVRKICEQLNISLQIIHFDVDEYLKKHPGESLEMACRNLRYEWFFSQMETNSLHRITTGHNADDNIETFFLNAFRGCGSQGLKGMEHDTGKIWRPLLCMHRTEILDYLNENDIAYITDSSNLQSDFRRNFLRNDIIPLLRSRWLGFDKAMDSTIAHIYSENKVIENLIKRLLPDEGKPLKTEIIIEFPNPELLIRRYIQPLGPYTTTPSEIIDAIRANKPHIRRWSLRNGEVVLRNHALHLCLSK